jgi:phosphoribosylanthranilate isomerase
MGMAIGLPCRPPSTRFHVWATRGLPNPHFLAKNFRTAIPPEDSNYQWTGFKGISQTRSSPASLRLLVSWGFSAEEPRVAVRTRVKICGITRLDDALRAADLGADAIGLVFYSKSPRYLEPAAAARWIHRVPAFVTMVGLFLDATPSMVEDALSELPLELLQFHGRESAPDCLRYGRPYIKALGMGGDADVLMQARAHGLARGMLLDSHAPGEAGGRGVGFSWERIPAERPLPLILAGGLDATNVAAAIRQVQPMAVDVSSGVESAPGIKDPQRMHEFMESVRRADAKS